jgi:hypothetical protein
MILKWAILGPIQFHRISPLPSRVWGAEPMRSFRVLGLGTSLLGMAGKNHGKKHGEIMGKSWKIMGKSWENPV